MPYNRYIGIDYSGRGTSSTLQVYACEPGCTEPEFIPTPTSNARRRNWNRIELAEWLAEQFRTDRVLVGIDHSFSMPISYFDRYGLKDWDGFLQDFVQHWPTHRAGVQVDDIRKPRGVVSSDLPRTGQTSEFRLTERWTSSAKSVFQFDMQGSVAKSTHAGIPWLKQLRDEAADRLHFWPFDGWQPAATKSVIAEVYPSVFRNRYPRADRSVDQQDAYSVAKWLVTTDERGILGGYFCPPLTDEEQTLAQREGWILGVA